MSERLGPLYASSDYAGFIRRSLALLVDCTVIVALAIATIVLWNSLSPEGPESDEVPDWIVIAVWLGALAYMISFRMTQRGTPGYRLVGIRYAPMTSEAPTWISLAFRALVAVFLLWGFIFDHIWILVDERKQAWHDKLSGFYVVKRGAQPIGTQRVVRRVINFMTLTFEVWEPQKENADRPPSG